MKKSNNFITLAVLSLYSLVSFAQMQIPDEEEKPVKKIQRSEQKRAAKALWYYQKVDQYAQTSKYLKRLQERLEKNQIIGIELVIAAPTESAVESHWGHSMMRFVDNVGTPADDVMFGFVAEVDDLKINYVKGIVGSYPTYPALQSLRLFNQQYIKEQDRPLERVIVPSTPEFRRQMVERLLSEWEEIQQKNTDSYQREITQALEKVRKVQARKKFKNTKLEFLKTDSDLIYSIALLDGEDVVYSEPIYFRMAKASDLAGYTFLSQNCAGALISFLDNLQVISKSNLGWDGRVPVNLPQYFEKNGLAYLPKLVIPGIYDLKEKILKIVNLKAEELYDFEKWPKDVATQFVEQLTVREKLIFLETYTLFPDEVIAAVKKSVPATKPTYEETFGIVSVSEKAYQNCTTVECAKEQIKLFNLDKKVLENTLSKVKLNQERLSTENFQWLNMHYQSFKKSL